jgi:hypothetical protein
VGAEVGGKPTAVADAGAIAAVGWVGRAVVVHRPIPRMSTIRQSCHNLSLLSFLVGMDCIVRDHDITDKL